MDIFHLTESAVHHTPGHHSKMRRSTTAGQRKLDLQEMLNYFHRSDCELRSQQSEINDVPLLPSIITGDTERRFVILTGLLFNLAFQIYHQYFKIHPNQVPRENVGVNLTS